MSPTGLDTGYCVMSHLNHQLTDPPPPLLGPVWQQAPPSLATHSQSCTFHPSLVHFTPWPISGGHELGNFHERATTQSVIGGGGQERTGKEGRGLEGFCIYGVFIGINNKSCIILLSSVQILNNLGHVIFVLLLFPHRTIPERMVSCHYNPILSCRLSLTPKKVHVAMSGVNTPYN